MNGPLRRVSLTLLPIRKSVPPGAIEAFIQGTKSPTTEVHEVVSDVQSKAGEVLMHRVEALEGRLETDLDRSV
jgi:hypothetical protein